MTTQSRLRELFSYDEHSGELVRLKATSPNTKVGQVAGRINNKGYRQIMVDGVRYMAHRLVWMWVHGRFPPNELDHVNGIRNDNRLCNLREATKSENQQNVGPRSTNKSGYLGVSFYVKGGRWKAQITVDGRKRHIGLYDTPQEAYAAYLEAKRSGHRFQPTPRVHQDLLLEAMKRK